MITARVFRRFAVRENGIDSIVRVSRVLDVPAVPHDGVRLDFGDGSGEASVCAIRFVCSSNRGPGFYPPSVDILSSTEPGDRLKAALTAGWAPLEEPA